MKRVPPTVLIVLLTLIPTPTFADSSAPLPRLATRVAFPNLSVRPAGGDGLSR